MYWRKYDYFRLDKSTTYKNYQKHIDEFNAETSKKFIFMVSTRAELGFCIFYNKSTLFSHWVWTIKIFVFRVVISKNFATVFS